jgi:serine protease AprX
VQLPTSWPAVPVAERLQPWLAEQLATGTTAALPVMVSGETTAAAVAAVEAAGLTRLQTWDKVGIVVAQGTPDQLRAVVGQPGVRYVEGDQPLAYTLDTAHEATRSDQALATYSAPDGSRLDGKGVTVAVIDSGIDGTHPFFTRDGESKVVQNRKNACGATFFPALNEACFQQAPTNDTDNPSAGGHGTHVAGIVAGYETTTSTPSQVPLRGAAPEATLVGLSVGAAIGLLDSNAAMNWVVEHQQNPCRSAAAQTASEVDAECPPIRATNHSYGPLSEDEQGTTFAENSATVTIQRTLISQGVTPVWAAGNSGGDGSVARTNPPAMDPTPGVLMVASYDDGQNGNRDNQLSGFSSRGKDGAPGSYPDISAPGDLITSSCRPSLAVCQGAPSYDTGDYQTISGTSMATPYVAGVVAQLVQADPAIAPGEVEELIEDNAHKFEAGAAYEADPLNADDTTSFDKGHGLVDVAATLADQQGLPAPAAPAPRCGDTTPQAVDAEGDATQVVLVDTPGPSQPDLDLREAFLRWDATAQELTFHIRVTDLGGAEGDEYFRFYITRESDVEVFAIANRDATGEVFSLRQQASGATTSLTGAFDEQADEVRIVLPAAKYGEVVPGASLAEGDTIGVGQVLGQRDTVR